jgi:hypothetical protein
MPTLQLRELATRKVSVTTQLAEPKAERFPGALETRHLGTGKLRVRNRVMPRQVAIVTVPDHEHGIVMDLGPSRASSSLNRKMPTLVESISQKS